MSRVVVYHGSYGCDTGCCGHYLEVDGESPGWDNFDFGHPYEMPLTEEDKIAYAKEFIADRLGAEHVADLDWENSVVLGD